MNINFIVQEDFDNNSLLVLDNTRPNTGITEEDITSLELTISSTNLLTDIKLDCLAYIYENLNDRELYRITPETLGFDIFEDGLYTYSLSVNGATPTIDFYIVYNDLLEAYEEMVIATGYKVTVSTTGEIQYLTDESKDSLEEIRAVGAIVDELKNQRYKDKIISEVELIVDDLLFKGTRILEIINNN